MKVVVFTAYTGWKMHYATELEIIQRHLDAGDQVVHLHCGGELLACDINPYHVVERCRECIALRRSGLALISGELTSIQFFNLTRRDRRQIAAIKKRFDSIDELRDYRDENFDIGSAALSSIVSYLRNPQPDLKGYGNMAPRFIVAAFSVYRSMQNYLRKNKIDRVYVFNGRFAYARAVLRACQNMGVPCHIHERSKDLKHYNLYENAMPHELAYTERQIRLKWAEGQTDSQRNEIAEGFYFDRAKGVVQSWKSFIEDQQPGLLPTNWNTSKRNIAIFNSSEDEFVSIGDEWINPLYSSQQEGLERIIQSLSVPGHNIHLYLRVHPNLKGIENAQMRHLASLNSANLTVLPPEDPVSTYALIAHSNKVVTFGSTVGIEAVFWGTPSILAGQSFYRNLGGTYNPKSHEELMEMLDSDLTPKDKIAAHMYGYYMNASGIPFMYYEPINIHEGTFKGKRLIPMPTKWNAIQRTIDRIRPIYFARDALFALRSRWRATGTIFLH
jgi:hypothetical protein